MKRSFFIAGFIALVCAYGCKKAKGPANVPSAQTDNSVDTLLNMSAIINGEEWKTDSAYSYKILSSGNDSGVLNLMVISTQIKDNLATTIKFNITGYTGLKAYPINPPLTAATYYAGNERHAASSGSFNVQSDTANVLSGTFFFVADTIVVTNGTFKVALP